MDNTEPVKYVFKTRGNDVKRRKVLGWGNLKGNVMDILGVSHLSSYDTMYYMLEGCKIIVEDGHDFAGNNNT